MRSSLAKLAVMVLVVAFVAVPAFSSRTASEPVTPVEEKDWTILM